MLNVRSQFFKILYLCSVMTFPSFVLAGNLFHTRSIVACDPETRECGIAVTSYPQTSAVVPVGAPGMIVANQSFPSISTARAILKELRKGSDAASALSSALANDPLKALRQFGVAALSKESPTGVTVANFTGKKNTPEICDLVGPTYAVQANLQSSADVCQAMALGFESSTGSFPVRLLAALKAGTSVSSTAGGDFAATIRVFSNKWVFADITEISADANVDRSSHWQTQLEFNLVSYLSVITPGDEKDLVELTPERSEKIQTILKKLGYYGGQAQENWTAEAEQALLDFSSVNLFFPRQTVQNGSTILIDGPLASFIITGFNRKALVPKP